MHVHVHEQATCHGGHVDDGPPPLAVLPAHVLQAQVGSLDQRGLQTERGTSEIRSDKTPPPPPGGFNRKQRKNV